jgi:hypothetical protein
MNEMKQTETMSIDIISENPVNDHVKQETE